MAFSLQGCHCFGRLCILCHCSLRAPSSMALCCSVQEARIARGTRNSIPLSKFRRRSTVLFLPTWPHSRKCPPPGPAIRWAWGDGTGWRVGLFTIANHINYIHAEWYAVYEAIPKNERLKAVD